MSRLNSFDVYMDLYNASCVAAAVSEPEASEPGSTLIGKLHYRAFNHLSLPNARNCGYALPKDLGCAMDS